uniref:Uncharacterized protein n=1 Tax=Strigamia maritima TaxID=126957 RepID=T1J221_STRMM
MKRDAKPSSLGASFLLLIVITKRYEEPCYSNEQLRIPDTDTATNSVTESKVAKIINVDPYGVNLEFLSLSPATAERMMELHTPPHHHQQQHHHMDEPKKKHQFDQVSYNYRHKWMFRSSYCHLKPLRWNIERNNFHTIIDINQ